LKNSIWLAVKRLYTTVDVQCKNINVLISQVFFIRLCAVKKTTTK